MKKELLIEEIIQLLYKQNITFCIEPKHIFYYNWLYIQIKRTSIFINNITFDFRKYKIKTLNINKELFNTTLSLMDLFYIKTLILNYEYN